MIEGALVHKKKNQLSEEGMSWIEKNMHSKEVIEILKRNKQPIEIKDGIIQIDPSHPDYRFLMED